MKKFFNFKDIIISILVIVIVFLIIYPKSTKPNKSKIQIDSTSYPIHDTIFVDSLVEVKVEVGVPFEIKVEKIVEVPVYQTIDTAEIMKVYFARSSHEEVLMLPNSQGTITITDTISKNGIVNRKFISDIKKIIIKDTIYTKEQKKGQLFFGFNSGFNKNNVVSHIGTGLLIKTKEEKIFHVGVGLANRVLDGTNGKFTPYIDGGVYWKIKFKNNYK